MKILIYTTLILIVSSLYSCGNDGTQNAKNTSPGKKRTGNPKIDLWNEIKEAEDSMYSKKKKNQAKNIHYITYFTKLQEYYQKFPNDPKADSCLFAISCTDTGYPIGHAKHLEIQEQCGDTLLKKYPKSKFKIYVLQNLVLMYDQAINGKRNVPKIKKYYGDILAILPSTPEGIEAKKEIEERLKTIDKPIKFN